MQDDRFRKLFIQAHEEAGRSQKYTFLLKGKLRSLDREILKCIQDLKQRLLGWFWLWVALSLGAWVTDGLLFVVMQQNFHSKAFSLSSLQSALFLLKITFSLVAYGILVVAGVEILVVHVPEKLRGNLEEEVS